MGNPVVHFEIGGESAERTREFYSELFGWDIRVDETGYGLVDTGWTLASAEGSCRLRRRSRRT